MVSVVFYSNRHPQLLESLNHLEYLCLLPWMKMNDRYQDH